MNNNSLKLLQLTIDQTIKRVWKNNIKNDYNKLYLLKEDTLKNALYFHLRNELTDKFLEVNHLRIYTEFHYKGFIADLAIVQLAENIGLKEHLQDEVESILVIIEVKYKNGTSDLPFNNDVLKIKQYLDKRPLDLTQYYLAFFQEAVFYDPDWNSWLTENQKIWAKDRVTELTGYFVEGQPQPVWRVLTHKEMDQQSSIKNRLNRESILQAAERFNEKKSSKELYFYYLNVLKRTNKVTEEIKEAVEYLLYWKLGKISLKPTPSGKPISRRFSGNTYYVSGTTKSNRDAVEKALSDNLLELGLNFRDGDITYNAFKKVVNTLTMTSIVLPVFYIHIWNPENFPILDEKVWRTYKWSRGEALNKHTKPRSFSHYEEYISFFKKLVDTPDLDWRTVDKGIWVIGEADSGYSFQMPPYNSSLTRLCQHTHNTMMKVISSLKAGVRLNEIGRIIQREARKSGYKVIMNLCSHGIGKSLHEAPDGILPFYSKDDKRVLEEGTVITIEPFLSIGAEYAIESPDGWTFSLPNKGFCAQYEHTIIITRDQPIITTIA